MTFTNDAAVGRDDPRDDADVARGGRELHDAAGPRAHHGDGPPLRPGPMGDGARAPTGRRRTTTAPTRSASASIARRRAATPSHSTSRRCAIAYRQSRDRARLGAALVPPRARGTTGCAVGPHAVGRAGAPLQRGRRYRAGDAEDVGMPSTGRSTPSDSPRSRSSCDIQETRSTLVARRGVARTSRRSRGMPIPAAYEQPAHPLAYYQRCVVPPIGTSRAATRFPDDVTAVVSRGDGSVTAS